MNADSACFSRSQLTSEQLAEKSRIGVVGCGSESIRVSGEAVAAGVVAEGVGSLDVGVPGSSMLAMFKRNSYRRDRRRSTNWASSDGQRRPRVGKTREGGSLSIHRTMYLSRAEAIIDSGSGGARNDCFSAADPNGRSVRVIKGKGANATSSAIAVGPAACSVVAGHKTQAGLGVAWQHGYRRCPQGTWEERVRTRPDL